MLDYFYRQVRDLIESIREEASQQGLLPLLRPVAPFNSAPLLTPIVTVGALLSVIVLSGIAVSAFATLFVALLVLYFLMTEVFGVSVEFAPFSAAGQRF